LKLFFYILFSLFPLFAQAEVGRDWDFKAQFYQRDNSRNTLKGRGAAWVRKGGRQIWADELEVDLTLNRVFATGNVHINDGKIDIFCDSGTYSLEGADGTLENVTVLFGQTVISGTALKQVAQDQYELTNGIFTNCNTTPFIDKEAGRCPFDVKIYARKFFLTLDSYVHIYDGIIYAKELPVFYTPYFIAPAKTSRQSGILVPSTNYRQRLGTGFSIPLFLALSRWQDLTITPTWWTLIGYHLELDYRYVYSTTQKGRARFFLLERSFNPDATIPWIRTPGRRYLGVASEAAVDIHHQFFVGDIYSRQDINLVTNRYWNQDFPNDFGPIGNFQYLRNLFSFSYPTDSYLSTAAMKFNQSLVNTLDSGADHGAVVQLPEVRFHKKTEPFLLKHLYFEWDNRFSNYFRPEGAFDNIPDQRLTTNPDNSQNDPLIDLSHPLNTDASPDYDSNDYIRTGQRLYMSRRLIANSPLAPGFQLQPSLRAGLLAYHFSLPQPSFKSQTFVETEIPFALYLARNFESDGPQKEVVRHVFQPRVLYGASLFKSKTPDHPFFKQGIYPDFASPRFDALDDNSPYEYFRFELNNRLMKKTSLGSQRFLLAQISNNYFLKPSSVNNGEAGLGPIESYLDLQLGQFSAQIQGVYQLRTSRGVHEQDWSGTFSYANTQGDRLSIATLLRKRSDETQNDETVVLSAYKTLPIYFDMFGSIEQSFRQSLTRNYQVGFLFSAKPRSCWSLSFLSGRTVQKEHYAKLVFGLSFGQP
jgi:hypothetical protein